MGDSWVKVSGTKRVTVVIEDVYIKKFDFLASENATVVVEELEIVV